MDSEKKLWFKNKTYGFGWVPATKEGWIVILVYIIVLSTSAFFIDYILPEYLFGPAFACSVFFLTGILLVISYRKGERPRWQWGRKDSL